VSAGYTTLVIDSLTHAWAGEGGLLEQKEQLDSRAKGNSYTNWAVITKNTSHLKAQFCNQTCISSQRCAQNKNYVLVDKNGKQVPQKVGMAPVQRDGMEYEFTIVFDVAMNHEAEASKDRTGLFTDKIFRFAVDPVFSQNISSGLTVYFSFFGYGLLVHLLFYYYYILLMELPIH
jgi:hypothetical protein